MNLLLDTCSFLWGCLEPENLSEVASEAIAVPENRIFLHQMSVLEIQIKYRIGKLNLLMTPEEFIPQAMESLDIEQHGLENKVIYLLNNLPPIHRDPFDRILVAHAICHGLTILTPDPHIHRYPVNCLW